MCNIILDLCITVGLNICLINVNQTIKQKRESLAALDLTVFVVFVMNTKGMFTFDCLFFLMLLFRCKMKKVMHYLFLSYICFTAFLHLFLFIITKIK